MGNNSLTKNVGIHQSHVLLTLASILAACLFLNVIPHDIYTTSLSLSYNVILFNFLAGLILLALLLLLIRGTLTFDLSDIYLILFTAYIVINYYIRSSGFNNTLTSAVLITALYIVLKQFVARFSNARIFYYSITGFLIASIIESAIGIGQLYNFLPRKEKYISGSFYNSGIFAIYTSSAGLFSMAFYLFDESKERRNNFIKMLCLINMAMCVIILPSTYARASWLAILIIGSLLLIKKFRNRLNFLYRAPYLFSTLIICVMSAILISLYYLKKDSADGRLVIWKTSTIAVNQNPITGHGYDHIKNKFGDYQSVYFASNPEDAVQYPDKIEYAFNDLIQIQVENGIIGILLFLLFLLTIYRNVKKAHMRDPYIIASISGSLVILISGMFSYPLEIVSIRYVLFFMLAIISAHTAGSTKLKISGIPLIIIASVSMLWIGNSLAQQYSTFRAKGYFLSAQKAAYSEDLAAALRGYAKALSYLPDQFSILPSQGLALLKSNKIREAIIVLSKADKQITDPFLSSNLGLAYAADKRFNEAETAFKKAILIMPNRAYQKYLLANVYEDAGKTDKALSLASEILTMQIKVESSAMNEIKLNMKRLIEEHTE